MNVRQIRLRRFLPARLVSSAFSMRRHWVWTSQASWPSGRPAHIVLSRRSNPAIYALPDEDPLCNFEILPLIRFRTLLRIWFFFYRFVSFWSVLIGYLSSSFFYSMGTFLSKICTSVLFLSTHTCTHTLLYMYLHNLPWKHAKTADFYWSVTDQQMGGPLHDFISQYHLPITCIFRCVLASL